MATQDVALTIWKVSIDNDGKANTFKQLKTLLHQKLHLNVSEIKLTLPKELEESITQLRKRFLAHNDADKSKVCDIRVELEPIENALAELRSFLNKLCCINLIQDNTMMKDYLVYRLMGNFGVASPLCSYVYITVNGEDWGLYLAVEGVEDAFLERNYGGETGELYKPDSMSFGGGRGNGKDFNMEDFDDMDFEPSGFEDGTGKNPNFGNFSPGDPQLPGEESGTPPEMPDDSAQTSSDSADEAIGKTGGKRPGMPGGRWLWRGKWFERCEAAIHRRRPEELRKYF